MLKIKQLQTLANIILQKKVKVTLSKWLAELRDTYGFGILDIKGKHLLLSEQDYQTLEWIIRQYIAPSIELDQLLKPNAKERIQTSAIFNDDKAGAAKAGEEWLLVRSILGPLKLKQAIVNNPVSAICVMDKETLVNHQHQALLVVENKALMKSIHQAKLPEEVIRMDPLVVYRGDEYFSTRTSLDFIKNQLKEHPEKPLYLFTDFDPKGLVIAMAYPSIKGFIVPTQEIVWQKHTNLDNFIKQTESMRTLELNAMLWNTNIQHMIRLMDKKQTAITQEIMVARSLPLTTINIS